MNLTSIKNWVSEKINDFMHSEKFISWAQNEAAPVIKKDLENFLDQPTVKEKIHEYQQDPQKLEEDFLNFTGYLDVVDKIFTVIDIASIVAIALTFLQSFGGSAAAGMGIRTLIQQVVKQGMKTVGKTIIRRALAAVSSGVLKKYAMIGATRFSAGVIREIGWRVAIHSALSGVLRSLEIGGLGALIAAKDAIRKHGADLGMPMALIDKVTHPDVDAITFKSIIENYISDIGTYVTNLVTTKTGLAHITIGGLARSLGLNKLATYRRFSEGFHTSLAAAKAGTLTAATYAKTYGAREKFHQAQELLEQQKDPSKKKKKKSRDRHEADDVDISAALDKSAIPRALHKNYRRMLLDATYEKSPAVANKLIDEKISTANYRVAEAVELLQEMTILDFIQQYEKQLLLPHNEFQLDELLQDVTNVEAVSQDALMKKLGVESLAELAKVLRSKKAEELIGLLDSLALGDEDLDAVKQDLISKNRLDKFKETLKEEVLSEQNKIPKSATLEKAQNSY